MSMQMPAEESQEQPKQKAIDYQRQMFELYENLIWCINQINRFYTAFPSLQNWNPQTQPNPYQFLIDQQTNSYSYPQNIVPTPVEEPNPNVPTFTKRTVKPVEEPEPKVKPPWYRQKGIIFAIILGIAMCYFIYLFYMKSTGHSVTIPGIGKM